MIGFLCVLDASALLALLHEESGADAVLGFLGDAAMSAVNWSETVQKLDARGVPVDGIRTNIEALGVTIVPFDADQAEDAASLWRPAAQARLSLGDRACLALARRLGVPAITADKSWATLHLAAEVKVIR